MRAREIQTEIYNKLKKYFDSKVVKLEWSVRSEAADLFGDRGAYGPRLDIAVGPFNLTPKDQFQQRDAETINNFQHPLVRCLENVICKQNHSHLYRNINPRCLIAIEVEGDTTSKHILGGMTNASMLGRIGVVVGPSAHVTKLRRIHKYALNLKRVGKASPDMFGNVACLESAEFLELLQRECGNQTTSTA